MHLQSPAANKYCVTLGARELSVVFLQIPVALAPISQLKLSPLHLHIICDVQLHQLLSLLWELDANVSHG